MSGKVSSKKANHIFILYHCLSPYIISYNKYLDGFDSRRLHHDFNKLRIIFHCQSIVNYNHPSSVSVNPSQVICLYLEIPLKCLVGGVNGCSFDFLWWVIRPQCPRWCVTSSTIQVDPGNTKGITWPLPPFVKVFSPKGYPSCVALDAFCMAEEVETW